MMTDNIVDFPSLNEQHIRSHVEFIFNSTQQDDAVFQISLLNQGSFFSKDQVEDAIEKAINLNSQGKSVYCIYAGLSPNTAPFGRAGDDDFYTSNFVWCDIDDPHNPEDLKKLYEHCPPTIAIVTAREPHRRIQLAWLLKESCEDPSTLREALIGICDNLGGDPKVTNPTSLMRLGGTVNFPNPDKLAKGRTQETTVFNIINNNSYYIDDIINAYPVQNIDGFIQTQEQEYKYAQDGALLLTPKVEDGRETLMHKMTCAAIINLTEQLKRWPEPQEVFDDVWPVYSRSVKSRTGSLENEGRGQKALKQKIHSKLRNFQNGRMGRYGFGSVADVIKNSRTNTYKETGIIGPETGKITQSLLSNWVASDHFKGQAKPIEWLVEGIFPLGVPVLYAAMGGLGKSFSVLDMAIKVASTTKTIAPQKAFGGNICSKGKVVYISAEDSKDSIHRRINALVDDNGLAATLDNLIILPMPEIGHQLLIRDGNNGIETTEFFALLREELGQTDNLKFIAIDPLQAFVGADITSKPEAGQFMWSAFANICAKTGATLMCTHHMRKDGLKNIKTAADAREAIRGSTALIDGSRLTYAMWQADEADGYKIAHVTGKEYEPHKFVRGAVVKTNDLADQTIHNYSREDSGVLADLGAINISDIQTAGLTNDQAGQALREIRVAWESGNPYRAAPQSARCVVKWLMKTFKISRAEATWQRDNWMCPPLGSEPLIEERNFKTQNRETKTGLYVVNIP